MFYVQAPSENRFPSFEIFRLFSAFQLPIFQEPAMGRRPFSSPNPSSCLQDLDLLLKSPACLIPFLVVYRSASSFHLPELRQFPEHCLVYLRLIPRMNFINYVGSQVSTLQFLKPFISISLKAQFIPHLHHQPLTARNVFCFMPCQVAIVDSSHLLLKNLFSSWQLEELGLYCELYWHMFERRFSPCSIQTSASVFTFLEPLVLV